MSLPSCRRRATTAALLIIAAAILLPVAQADAQRQKQAAPAAQVTEPEAYAIDRNGVLMLVRSAILALDHANKTGNYTVLRDLGAPGFQKNSAARLSEIFAAHRAQQLDLGGILVLEPQLTVMPRIENGMLRMAGFFPSVPAQVHFDLLFAPVERQWRLFGISVNVSPGAPMAPDGPPEPEPEVSSERPDPPVPSVNPLRQNSP